MKVRLNPFGILARMRKKDESNDGSFFQKIKEGAKYITVHTTLMSKWHVLNAIVLGNSIDGVGSEILFQIQAKVISLYMSPRVAAKREAITEIRAGLIDYVFLGIPLILRVGFHLLREKYNQITNNPGADDRRVLRKTRDGVDIYVDTAAFKCKKFFLGLALAILGIINMLVAEARLWVSRAINLAIFFLVIFPMEIIGALSKKIQVGIDDIQPSNFKQGSGSLAALLLLPTQAQKIDSNASPSSNAQNQTYSVEAEAFATTAAITPKFFSDVRQAIIDNDEPGTLNLDLK